MQELGASFRKAHSTLVSGKADLPLLDQRTSQSAMVAVVEFTRKYGGVAVATEPDPRSAPC